MTSGPSNIQSNINIAKNSEQSVEWYREIITQLIENQVALKQQLDKQGHRLVKILSVKHYLGEVYKLRGFLI